MVDKKRRNLLKIASAAGIAGLGYSFYTGVRFPPLMLHVAQVDKQRTLGNQHVGLTDAIFMPQMENEIHLRAYAPEPKVSIRSEKTERINVVINNIGEDSLLKVQGATLIDEQIVGITRHITLAVTQNELAELVWEFIDQDYFQFASIGDTGGGPELDWCLQRAHELQARFLLHLGDFHYMDGEYETAIDQFYNAPLPCYVTIGNHDFSDDGVHYHKFQHEIGTMNNQFRLGDTRFINVDTASNFFPVGSGHRGELMNRLIAEKDQVHDSVLFTHKPLKDPRPNETHDISGIGEIPWFAGMLHAAKIDTMLCGHIHIQAESDYEGIRNIIAGQGLGHQDLIVKKPISQMIIGTVEKNKKVSYEWRDLNMPVLMHCNERNVKTLELSNQLELKQQLAEACKT